MKNTINVPLQKMAMDMRKISSLWIALSAKYEKEKNRVLLRQALKFYNIHRDLKWTEIELNNVL